MKKLFRRFWWVILLVMILLACVIFRNYLLDFYHRLVWPIGPGSMLPSPWDV